MNRREKTLAILVASVIAILLVGLGLRWLIFLPLKAIDKQTSLLRDKLAKIQAEKRSYFEAEDQVKRWTQRTFSDTVDQASAKSGEMLTQLILHSGLREDEFTRLPVGPRLVRAASGSTWGGNEIGWNIQGEGPIISVINLLFLLQESPYLTRIDGLAVSPGSKPGNVDVRFRYLTLVIDPAPTVETIPVSWKYTLQSPERRMFDTIRDRDIMRPYIRRPPTPPGKVAAAGGGAASASLGPENYRVVDLSEWQGRTEIAVMEKPSEHISRHRIGDPLAGGVVVMVDTRPLPRPDRAGVLSFSRVILQIGNEYWAVELGQTLAEKYKLAPEQLPEKLPRL